MPKSKKRKGAASRPRRDTAGLVPGFSNRERLGLGKIFAGIIRDSAREIGPRTPPLEVLLWASEVWGIWYGKDLIGQDAEKVFGGGLVSHAVAGRSPAALRVLRALAAVAPRAYATAAAKAAGRLNAAGVADPPWARALAAPPLPTGAWVHEDPVEDDGTAWMVGFDGPVGPHTIGVYVDHTAAASRTHACGRRSRPSPSTSGRCAMRPWTPGIWHIDERISAVPVCSLWS